MPPEDAIQIADEVLLVQVGNPLTDIQRLILRESLAGKGYERMEGYAPQHIKNEGKKLWDLLSEALGEKVSKTSFEGALEKRWKLGKLIPKPPLLSIYNPQTWVGRKAIIDECLPKLHGRTRILWITGISGIGKTALGECLASQAWQGDPSFQWVYLEILEGQSVEFVSVAAELLAKLGEVDLDPQERNDPKRLMERLIRKLNSSRYWLQVDSLERLLSSEQPTETEFADHHWGTFLQRCLTEPNFASRLVLTAQALPSSLAEFEERYPNCWQAITLQGLLAYQPDDLQWNEHLALFAKNGLRVDDSNSSHLRRIGQIYEGHPLVLQVIAKEILAAPFAGNVAKYWERYGNEFEQVARELQAERVRPELYNQALQKRVRRRVELSLKQLPPNALELLCRSSVYRRPVLETFWLSMLEEQTSQRRQQAYQILHERAFVEREGIHQNQFLIRQHNLVRAVAHDLLKADPQMWHQSERQAAHLWLTVYEPAANAPNLETVRGYLEAFDHYCEVEDWEKAGEIYMQNLETTNQALHQQLFIWSNYQELIKISDRLAQDVSSVQIRCFLNLGNSNNCLGNPNRAIEWYEKALSTAQEIGDRRGEGSSLGNLGLAYNRLGQYERAIDYIQQYLTISRELEDLRGEGNALGNLGNAYYRLGQYERAIDLYQELLTISRELDNPKGKGAALGNLGNAYRILGQYEQAIDFLQQSLAITREIGDRHSEGNALGNLGSAYYNLRQYERAIDLHQQALVISREIGDRQGEGADLVNTGATQLKLEQYPEALTNNQTALQIFQEIGSRDGEAAALKNLAELHQALGEVEVARQYCQQALELATELGIPLAEECQKLKQELAERGAEEGK
ncbi:MAG: tetratricopeptide repeat protein [Leptolyngbyaceae cyanobacterium HOT.MB2.61]|nr:tetratricopeptide repeat protein [Leptolyngbyaceae cyanobacterium HOT.MB2.61]